MLVVAPHVGPVFPRVNPATGTTNTNGPPPGFFWLYLTFIGAMLVNWGLAVIYEGIATARYGRTLGKAWLHIRPLRVDGARLGTGRGFARAALYAAGSLLGWIGLADVLWCVWDDKRQCVHDKIVDTIVVSDR
jgi:uncharacterized RDD family membrane protein YckC